MNTLTEAALGFLPSVVFVMNAGLNVHMKGPSADG